MLKLYRIIWKIGSPLIELYLWRRKKLGKEDPYRYEERLGVPSLPRPNTKLVWIHAASVGEAASVLPVVEEMLNGNAWLQIMVTTGTVTSAMLMEQRLPHRAFHQYVPIDKQEYVEEFIDYWQPDMAIWVESEFWPNLIHTTREWGCPMVLLNARISEESFEKWSKYKNFFRDILDCFDLILPQSREDANKLKALGARKVRYLGNLKYGANALPYDEAELDRLQKMIGKRMVWVAASTHPGEEEQIIKAHLKIKEKSYGVLTVIVPRHPSRGSQIRANMPDWINTSLRSNNEKILDDTDIYIADTLGELGLFYRLSPIVFVGGSLVPHGGHNPIEPAHFECAIVSGPYMDNFSEIMTEFDKAGAVRIATNSTELAQAVFELWHNPQKRKAMSSLAYKHINKKSEVLQNIVDELEQFI